MGCSSNTTEQLSTHACILNYLLLFSHLVMSSSLWPHGQQDTRPPCPVLPHGVCSNSCPLSRYCHPTISFSVAPFSSCPQSFPASGSFPVSRILSGGQSTELQHQFFSAQASLWSRCHTCTWLLEKPWLWHYGPLSTKWCLCFLICCLFNTIFNFLHF